MVSEARSWEQGARSGRRERRVVRVKGSASRGEGSSTRMSTRKNADARFALSVNCYWPRKRLRLTRRGIEYEHEHEHEHKHSTSMREKVRTSLELRITH